MEVKMKTPYSKIVNIDKICTPCDLDLNDLFELASQESSFHLNDADKDLLLCIDLQNDFMEGGALGVPGSKGDVERITKFIYSKMYNLSILYSMDTHSIYSIFHNVWWRDPEGNHPEPFTIITYEDVLNGKWAATNPEDQQKSLDYLEKLEASEGKKQLCIWPIHCIPNTKGWELEGQFARMLHFHSMVTGSKNEIVVKGDNPYTEMYGIISPEVNDDEFFSYKVIDAIAKYRKVYICGEAASHCVLESIKQVVEYFKGCKDVIENIIVLEDCMSPISGYEEETEKAFAELKEFGVKFMSTTDIAA